MIKGVEFLKSWRFWAWMLGSTGLMTLTMTGVHFLNARYFGRMADGSPDPLYPILLGFLLLVPAVVLQRRILKRTGTDCFERYEYGGRAPFVVYVTTIVLAGIEFHVAKQFLSVPVLESAKNTLPLPFFVWPVGVLIGWPIALLEYARITGAGGDAPDPQTTPDSL